ncbi:MAG: hypothetical protein GH155_07365 [Spirochaeta sp.]|nr:hypothetical protein [Spirochaeta sp.]
MRRIKVLDFLAFLTAIAVTALIAFQVYGSQSGALQVSIKGDSGEWLYPLESGHTIGIEGPLGTTTVVIEHGTVRVSSSPCREKICVKSGPVNNHGRWIACLPNRVIITVTGSNEQELDGLTF